LGSIDAVRITFGVSAAVASPALPAAKWPTQLSVSYLKITSNVTAVQPENQVLADSETSVVILVTPFELRHN
jgi:hypothetical protein